MIWIIGKSIKAIRDYLHEHDVPFAILADSAAPSYRTHASVTYYADFSSRQTLYDSLALIDATPSGLLLVGFEDYVLPLAWLNEYYDLPGLSPAAAINATDKTAMRRALRAYDPALAPDWQAVTSAAECLSFAGQYGYPVVLKPSNLSKSRYVSINHTPQQLTDNLAISSTALQGRSELLVESFLDGSMHTIVGFVNAQGVISLSEIIVDCVMAKDHGNDDSFVAERRLPTALDAAEVARLLEVSRHAVTALGLRGVGLHIELMLTEDGPKIIEVAARLGGYRVRMYDQACGIDLYGCLLAIATNQPFDLRPQHTGHYAVIEVFPTAVGTIKAITGLEQLDAIPGVQQYMIKHPVGTNAGPAKAGYKAALIIMLAANEKVIIDQAVSYIAEHVTVVAV